MREGLHPSFMTGVEAKQGPRRWMPELPPSVSAPRVLNGIASGHFLAAEPADDDAWRLLSDVARAAGQAELADSFAAPVEQETEHLEVRTWLQAA